MPLLTRKKLTVLRCPAIGGVLVPETTCTGLVQDGEQLIGRCPYFHSHSTEDLKCSYHPSGPKRVSAHNHSDKVRETIVVTGLHAATTVNIFPVQVHGGKAHGPEFDSAKVNIL